MDHNFNIFHEKGVQIRVNQSSKWNVAEAYNTGHFFNQWD